MKEELNSKVCKERSKWNGQSAAGDGSYARGCSAHAMVVAMGTGGWRRYKGEALVVRGGTHEEVGALAAAGARVGVSHGMEGRGGLVGRAGKKWLAGASGAKEV